MTLTNENELCLLISLRKAIKDKPLVPTGL